jgi:hypothetical protein
MWEPRRLTILWLSRPVTGRTLPFYPCVVQVPPTTFSLDVITSSRGWWTANYEFEDYFPLFTFPNSLRSRHRAPRNARYHLSRFIRMDTIFASAWVFVITDGQTDRYRDVRPRYKDGKIALIVNPCVFISELHYDCLRLCTWNTSRTAQPILMKFNIGDI